MRIFLDECVDRRLATAISGHDVKTARQMRWTAIKNGELLALAQKEFDVFVTVDRNLSFQQNTATLSIAVVVLAAQSNRLQDLVMLVPQLLARLETVERGVVTLISSDDNAL